MTRLRLIRTPTIGALLCVQLSSPAAIAQDHSGDALQKPPADILVVGANEKERSERALAYVRATGIARGQRPAARWIEPICPKVSGIAPERAAIVADRIRALATEVGAPLASANCTVNAIVTFTTDARGVANRTFDRAPYQFKDVPAADREMLLHGEAPIRWWHIIKAGDADGVPPVNMQPTFVQIEGGLAGAGLPMGEGGVQQRYKEGAVSSQSTRAITGASVVIDVSKPDQRRELRALGDYAAVVTLAEFRPSSSPPPDSILGLFAASDTPEVITASDIALLRQLYSLPLDRDARAHRRMLAGALVKEQSGRSHKR